MGTGLTECLYSACLSKVARYRNLIIDIDSTYSSSIRTLSLKELHNFLDSEALASVSNTKKKSPFTVIPLRSEEERVRNNSFYQECLDNGAYRVIYFFHERKLKKILNKKKI
jgi:RAB protein geranylgeranyltransferase component A